MIPSFANSDDKESSYKLACGGCGAVAETSAPMAVGATYSCKGCNSSPRKRKRDRKRKSPIQANSAALKARLEQFTTLSFDGHEAEWFELALRLNVDPVNVLELVEAVHNGGWSGSNAPKQYLNRRVSELTERNGTGMQDPFVYEGIVYKRGEKLRSWKRRYDGKTVCFSERNADPKFDVDVVADTEVHESIVLLEVKMTWLLANSQQSFGSSVPAV